MDSVNGILKSSIELQEGKRKKTARTHFITYKLHIVKTKLKQLRGD